MVQCLSPPLLLSVALEARVSHTIAMEEPLLHEHASTGAQSAPQSHSPGGIRSLWSPSRRASATTTPPAERREDSFATSGRSGPVMCSFHFTRDGHVTSLHPNVALDFVRDGYGRATSGSSATGGGNQDGDHNDGSWTWVHLSRSHPEAAAWLSQVASVSDAARDGLLSDDSRPRCIQGVGGRSLLLRLRGLHRYTGDAETEVNDMWTITLLVQPDKVVSTAEVSLEAVRHARELLYEYPGAGVGGAHASGNGQSYTYRTPGAFVSQMCEFLMDDALQVVAALQDDLDAFEERRGEADEEQGGGTLTQLDPATALGSQDMAIAALAAHRRTAVKLRRWVGPQREALKELVLKGSAWLFTDNDEATRLRLRSAMDATSQLLESLDAIREHALVLKDELAALQQMRANYALYLLSVVSALFLPFSFVTGLFSMSIGGIPGREDDRAFYIVSSGCVGVLLLGVILFKRLRWL